MFQYQKRSPPYTRFQISLTLASTSLISALYLRPVLRLSISLRHIQSVTALTTFPWSLSWERYSSRHIYKSEDGMKIIKQPPVGVTFQEDRLVRASEMGDQQQPNKVEFAPNAKLNGNPLVIN